MPTSFLLLLYIAALVKQTYQPAIQRCLKFALQLALCVYVRVKDLERQRESVCVNG